MSLPTQGDVHVNGPLTNLSIAYLQNQSHFVADQVFPNIPVQKQSDVYYTFDRGMFNRNEMAIRAAGAESAGAGYTVDGTPNYFALPYAIHKDIPDMVRGNADSVLDMDRQAMEFVSHKAMIKREVLWGSKYFATSIWTTDIAGIVAAPVAGTSALYWSDANSTPIEDVRTGIATVLASTGFEPNVLTLGYNVFIKLIDHPDIVDRVKYGQTSGGPAMVGESELAALFKVDKVVVAKSIQNTAAEGIANAHSFILGKNALLTYAAPSPGIMVPSGGYTFSWTGLHGAGALGGRIKKFRMENLASDRVEMEMAMDQKLVSADLGYFFGAIVP